MTPHDILLIFFALLQLGDIYTTYRILKNGGRELNPVMAELFKLFDVLPALLVVKMLVIVLVWWADIFYLTMGSCVAYVAVVSNNFRVLNALQKP